MPDRRGYQRVRGRRNVGMREAITDLSAKPLIGRAEEVRP